MEKARPKPQQPRIGLTEARGEQAWSQQEVADRIGTTYVNVSRWERGITRPSPYFRKKLCMLFGKTELELELVTESKAPPPPVVVESVPTVQPAPLPTQPLIQPMLAPYTTPGALYDPAIPLPPPIHLVGRYDELAHLKQRLRS